MYFTKKAWFHFKTNEHSVKAKHKKYLKFLKG